MSKKSALRSSTSTVLVIINDPTNQLNLFRKKSSNCMIKLKSLLKKHKFLPKIFYMFTTREILQKNRELFLKAKCNENFRKY